MLNLIVDPSALVYGGIGKLKRWCSKPGVSLHIPTYTLQELDYLKKVYNPLVSANARESIKFIDESMTDSLYLQTPEEDGPNWFKVSGYRKYTPDAIDLPMVNGVGVFGEKVGFNENFTNTFAFDDDNGDNAEPQNASGNSETSCGLLEKPKIPKNLKTFIRYLIKKHYIDNKSKGKHAKTVWLVVVEDDATKVWLRSFGFNVINLFVADGLVNGFISVDDVLNGRLDKLKNVNSIIQEAQANADASRSKASVTIEKKTKDEGNDSSVIFLQRHIDDENGDANNDKTDMDDSNNDHRADSFGSEDANNKQSEGYSADSEYKDDLNYGRFNYDEADPLGDPMSGTSMLFDPKTGGYVQAERGGRKGRGGRGRGSGRGRGDKGRSNRRRGKNTGKRSGNDTGHGESKQIEIHTTP
ncbi:hypothetical protein DAMA08_013950 [Martiniozyma asiatica (nom. inval.)]|nr:hypothetical protein DAMA08_013950 [Martiniozyma asiatica]